MLITELRDSERAEDFDVPHLAHVALNDLVEGKGEIVDPTGIELMRISFPINEEGRPEGTSFEMKLFDRGTPSVMFYYNGGCDGDVRDDRCLTGGPVDSDAWEQFLTLGNITKASM